MMLFAAASLAALHAFSCSEPDDTSSLAELAERDDVYVAVRQRHVACRCPGILLLCSSNCAPEIEVYALVLAREGAADGDPCEPHIDANARASGGQVGEVEVTSRCHETRYEWDGHSPPTQIVLEDATATWTLVDPFARPSATLVAPAAEDLGRGATARIEVPGVRLREATARLTSSRASSEDIVLDVGVEDDRAELTLPDDLLGGARYDLSFSSATELLPSVCEGPPACRGFSVHAQWSFSVPADPSAQREWRASLARSESSVHLARTATRADQIAQSSLLSVSACVDLGLAIERRVLERFRRSGPTAPGITPRRTGARSPTSERTSYSSERRIC